MSAFSQENIMQYYFAPLEGLTDSIYRKLHHTYYPGIHRYYTPFLSPTVHRALTAREARELPFTADRNFTEIPQLLTKNAEDFIWMAMQCRDRGYTEVNLNLGCPSGAVTAKKKGAGMLEDMDALDAFLDSIFRLSPIPISIKTRLGLHSTEEFPAILDIFNRYPICELTIHPRLRDGFYTAPIDMDTFRYAIENSKNPVCYNGNLCSQAQIEEFIAAFPGISSVMLGRGLIGNPGMLSKHKTTCENLKNFHNALLDTYLSEFGGARNAMFRLKEHWRYWFCLFENAEKFQKKIRKTTDIQEYRQITAQIFETLTICDDLTPNW